MVRYMTHSEQINELEKEIRNLLVEIELCDDEEQREIMQEDVKWLECEIDHVVNEWIDYDRDMKLYEEMFGTAV